MTPSGEFENNLEYKMHIQAFGDLNSKVLFMQSFLVSSAIKPP